MSRKHSHFDDPLKSSEDIVAYLIANVYKQNKIEFYQNLELSALQALVAANFQDKKYTHQEKLFVVTLIKQHPYILNIAFTHEKFDHYRVFGFLRVKAMIEWERLRAFEEIFLPFCKKFPEKVLAVFIKTPSIKDLLLEKIYLKHVFKIVYTTVFCMHSPHTAERASIIQEIVIHLVNSIFRFDPNTAEQLKFFDPTEVAGNFSDFLEDLQLNLSTVEVSLISILVERINEQYVEQILQLFNSWRSNADFTEYCELLIKILLNLTKIFEDIKINNNRQFSQQQTKQLEEISTNMLKITTLLSSQLPDFIGILVEKSNRTINYSSGEVIPTVGMINYRILELIEKLLSINELQDMRINFNDFDFFPVIEYYVEKHKWNNIVHNLLIKIAELIISQDYRHFKERYIIKTDEYADKFFGNLIANFRNRKYLYLHSLRMTNHGNRCPIYEISKMLVNEMKEQKDLGILIQNFKMWKEFMEQDLKQFETINYALPKISEQNIEVNINRRKQRHPSFDFIRSSTNELKEPSTRSLQTFEQILLKLKEEEKWSPIMSPEKNSKQKIQETLSRFDSMGLLDER